LADDRKYCGVCGAEHPPGYTLFELIDVNCSGKLSRSEWKKAFNDLMPLNHENNEVISLSDWKRHGGDPTLFEALMAPRSNIITKESWLLAFIHIDKDRGGTITRDEWYKAHEPTHWQVVKSRPVPAWSKQPLAPVSMQYGQPSPGSKEVVKELLERIYPPPSSPRGRSQQHTPPSSPRGRSQQHSKGHPVNARSSSPRADERLHLAEKLPIPVEFRQRPASPHDWQRPASPRSRQPIAAPHGVQQPVVPIIDNRSARGLAHGRR